MGRTRTAARAPGRRRRARRRRRSGPRRCASGCAPSSARWRSAPCSTSGPGAPRTRPPPRPAERCPAARPGCGAAAVLFDEIWYGGRPAGPEADAALRDAGRPGAGRPPRPGGAAVTVTSAPDVAPAGTSSTDPGAGQVCGGPSRDRWSCWWWCCWPGWCVALAAGGPAGGRLDPRSPAPSGARALAEVLGDQGVQVDLVTTSAAMSATAGPDDTLLVVDPDLLAAGQVEAVASTGADLVVVVDHGTGPLRAGRHRAARRPRRPRTRLRPAGGPAGRAVDAGASPTTPTTPAAAPAPLLLPRRPPVPGAGDGRTAAWSRCWARRRRCTNYRLDDEGNAALALGPARRQRPRWSGTSRRRPTCRRRPRSRSTTWCPTASGGGSLQVGVAVLLLALWRARRLGAVVVEPLPVVVRAAETVEGRARLYRRTVPAGRPPRRCGPASGPGSAAALGLPRRADPPAAGRGGRRPRPAGAGADVAALLYGAAPADDAALVRLADDLDALEREVRRP